jgi:hypothetical protein
MRDDDPEIMCGVVPINPFPWQKDEPPEPAPHRQVFLEITGQLIEYLSEAVKERDHKRGLRIMVQAERVMGEYTREGFYLLLPMQRDLRDAIYCAFRIARRLFIRKALLCPPEQIPQYQKDLEELGWCGPDATEDFRAVVRHLDEGTRLLGDLRYRCKVG